MRARDQIAELTAQIKRSRRELAATQRELVAARHELQAERARDAVTGLPLFTHFEDQIEREIQRAERYRRPLTLAVVDIDGFAVVNQSQGLAGGDWLLGAVARALEAVTRRQDHLCRTVADEFAVLMPESDLTAARSCLERLAAQLGHLPVDGSAVSASAGVASHVRGGSVDHILASARDALAEAQAEGPGGIVGCESDPLIGELDNLAPGARSTVRGLASMLAVRGNGSADPTIEIAERIARELQMGPSADVRAAALLRGVGSLAVPESILDKPGELDAVEWGLIRRRPDVAATLLRSLAGLDEVASIVRHEYERWDGTGYPDGLAGEQIPLGSRVLLASGAYFAMTSPRPWRRTLTHSEAVRQLSDNAGGQFDPEVVAVLIGRLHWMRQLGSAR